MEKNGRLCVFINLQVLINIILMHGGPSNSCCRDVQGVCCVVLCCVVYILSESCVFVSAHTVKDGKKEEKKRPRSRRSWCFRLRVFSLCIKCPSTFIPQTPALLLLLLLLFVRQSAAVCCRCSSYVFVSHFLLSCPWRFNQHCTIRDVLIIVK